MTAARSGRNPVSSQKRAGASGAGAVHGFTHFREAMDASADLVLVVDRASLRYVYVNDAACRALGYDREELIRMGPPELFSMSRREFMELYERMFSGEIAGPLARGQYRRKDGSLLPVEAFPRPVRSEGGEFVVTVARDIRDRLTSESALRASEQRFRDLTQLSSDWYWEQDDQFRFTFFSGPPMEEPTGIKNDAHLGKARWDLPTLNVTPEGWARHRAALERHEPFRDFEISRLGPDGRRRWNLVSGTPVFDAAGKFTGYRGIGRDVTERRRSELVLLLEHAVTRVLAEATGTQEAVEGVIRAVCEAQDWACGRYFRPDAQAAVLRFSSAWGLPTEEVQRFIAGSRDIVFAPGVGLTGRVWQSGEPLWVADVAKDARTSQQALSRSNDTHGAFVFPAMAEGKAVGVFAFSSREVRAPEQRLLDAIRVIGSQIGQFLKRMQAEEAKRDAEQRLRQTFELAGSGIAEVDLDRRFQLVNRSLCRMLGYDAAELLGRPLREFVHPDDRHLTDEASKRMREHGETMRFERRYLRRDGSTFWFDVNVALVRDAQGRPQYQIAVYDDITDRKREQISREIEHEATRVLSESGSLATAVRAVLKILCERLGWACAARWSVGEDGMLRRNESWGIADPAVQAFLRETRAVTQSAGPHGLIGRVFANQTPVQFAEVAGRGDFARAAHAAQAGLRGALALPLSIENKVMGAIEFFRREAVLASAWEVETLRRAGNQIALSMTRRQAEAEMRRSQDLARSNAELEQFAYVASHDLQEPLRMISSYTQLLMRRTEGKLDQDARDFAAFIVDGAARMKQLIEDLLAYSRVGSRGRAFQPTDCNRVLRQVLANLRLAIEQAGVTVTHDPLPTLPADDSQIAQLLQNLVGNAVKFRGTDAPRVHVGAEERDESWVLSVTDNGIGIESQYFERIFVMFQRLHGKTEYPGTGIGLAICRRVVERHGGHIQVESAPGRGSTFYCALPKRHDAESDYAEDGAR